MDQVMPALPYYLGLPLWANPQWKGSVFPVDAKAADFLAHYAQVFNAVEGNTTFYSVPSVEMVSRWLAVTPESFRFSFKFPRTITHQHHLSQAAQETQAFLQRMKPLGQRLDGLMVQLPATFSPADLPVLEAFLRRLPADFTYAVEVRHSAFFTQPAVRAAYNALLATLGVDRVIFDSRPLHSAAPVAEATRDAQRRKPRLPVQLDTPGNQPVVRYIGHPVLAENHAWLERWVAQTARWLTEGKCPRVFLHTPDNTFAPALARLFHQQLQQRIPTLPDLPAWITTPQQATLL